MMTDERTDPPPLLTFGYYLVRGDLREFSGCRSQMLPNSDLFTQKFSAGKVAQHWQIDENEATRLRRCHDEWLDKNQLIWYCLRYTELEIVRILKNEFFAERTDLHIIGVGTPVQWNEDITRMPEYRLLPPLPAGGNFIGYDLYGFDVEEAGKLVFSTYCAMLSCPFRCCDWDHQLTEQLGIKLNQYGYFPDWPATERALTHINREHLGEEQTCYVPFGIVEYPPQPVFHTPFFARKAKNYAKKV